MRRLIGSGGVPRLTTTRMGYLIPYVATSTSVAVIVGLYLLFTGELSFTFRHNTGLPADTYQDKEKPSTQADSSPSHRRTPGPCSVSACASVCRSRGQDGVFERTAGVFVELLS